ncbi:putative U6 snRNA-associated Sm-like protein LSm4 [Colletotrichum siamense]|uniref:putative U6 snRNA-associated Sm-like protein LSm4 n=1 Tax=Colletotrichum siamense TaxID=690259 RepID=UPI0018731455|nr:putative U6 snRNA-associated Sm-like protein LSm4 [Colletotrichum siamense]KAF4816646.1 putative U6 snRNA-associated Sm-like protein LSm4 [Colletotrichum siamense]KAF5497330.1 putative U6 snRNA-associated Sm-like protein LSm4 [Colletotrichum siamense]
MVRMPAPHLMLRACRGDCDSDVLFAFATACLANSGPLSQLPLGLLNAAQGHPMLVELKNGETLNGHLVMCDTWMNLTLKEVVQTSPEGDKFVKIPEVYVKGNNIKYLRVPDDIIDLVKENQQNNQGGFRGGRGGQSRGDHGGRGGDRGRGRGQRGGRGRGRGPSS